ncbi:MAG: hypothetical protein AAF799_19995 [Myxococcota bacterium]
MPTFRPIQGARVIAMVEPSRRLLAVLGALALSACVLPPLPADTDPAMESGSDSLSMTSTVGPGTSGPQADTAGDTDDALSVGETGSTTSSTSSGGTETDSSTSTTGTETGSSTSDMDTDSSTEDSGTESGEESGTDTGGDPEPPDAGCEAMCATGCDEILVAPLDGLPTLWHTSDARLALDEGGRAILWRVVDDALLARFDGVEAAELAGDVFVVQQGFVLSVRDSATVAELATIPAGTGTWGLSRDGDYLWSADGSAVRIYELDGTLRWDRSGDYSGASVLPLAGALHVWAPGLGTDIEHIDAVTEATTVTSVQGTFGGWFHDVARHWTTQGDAYRLYDTDGTQLAFAVGTPAYGYGDRMVVDGPGFSGAEIVDVTAVDTPLLAMSDIQISGPAMIGNGSGDQAEIVRLDDPALTTQLVLAECCVDDFGNYSFGWADDRWLLAGNEGEVYDDDGDRLAAGLVEEIFGSVSGRIAASSSIGITTAWEVTPACELSGLGSFERARRPAAFSGDGQTLVSVGNTPQLAINLYDVATWTIFDSAVYGLSTSSPVGLHVSDTAGIIGVSSFNTAAHNSLVYVHPGWDTWSGGNWTPTPAVAPNGTLAVRGDSSHGFGATFEGALSYIHDGSGLLGIFDGVTWGFVDDNTMLVAHYEEDPACPITTWSPGQCDLLAGVDIVDTAGLVVAASPMPDPANFQRISSTEVLLPDPPAIYDIYTGAVLWSGGAGPVAAVGPDHVAHTVGTDLVLTRWR